MRRVLAAFTAISESLMCIARTTLMLGLILSGTVSVLALDHQEASLLTARAISVGEHPLRAPVLSARELASRQEELQRWIEDFSKWKTWAAEWGNRRQPGWFTGSRRRMERPDPPAWLLEDCDFQRDGSAGTDVCALVAEWRTDDVATVVANARSVARNTQEADEKTVWWQHVHLDVAWPALQSGVKLVGVLGAHATVTVKNRFQVFVAPGVMLLNVPTHDGARAWKLASNYGVAYRLGQFRFPGNRQALLHLNLAKAWLVSAGPEVPTKSTDFVGFSITFKKKP